MTVICNLGYRQRLANTAPVLDGTASTNRFYIYKGTMPTNVSNWVIADNSSDLLAIFSNFTFVKSTAGNKDRIVCSTLPSPSTVNASATGTAAWYAFVNDSQTYKYFFGDVTTNAGTGSLHLDSVSLVSGNPVTIENFGIAFGE